MATELPAVHGHVASPDNQYRSKLVAHTMNEGWDGERAIAIPQQEWDRMFSFADSLDGEAWFSPCGDGTTHARWHDGGDWIEVEQRGGVYAITMSIGGDVSVQEGLGEVAAKRAVLYFWGPCPCCEDQ